MLDILRYISYIFKSASLYYAVALIYFYIQHYLQNY